MADISGNKYKVLPAINNENKNFDATEAITAEAKGLKIQLDMSKTMQDTWRSLNKYKIVFNMVVMNNENKYASNPNLGTKK